MKGWSKKGNLLHKDRGRIVFFGDSIFRDVYDVASKAEKGNKVGVYEANYCVKDRLKELLEGFTGIPI